MRTYKKWSGEERLRSLGLTNKAKKLGLISEPTKCNRCGQTEGILQLHNHDYDITLSIVPKMIDGTASKSEIQLVNDTLECLCWRCHMMLHSEHRAMEAVKKYFYEVSKGKKYPPVFKHDFNKLHDHDVH